MFIYAFLLVILICTACFYSIDIQFLKQLKLTTKSKKNSYSQQRVFKKQIISGPIITGIWPYGPNNQIQSALELLTIAKYFNATSYISPFYPHWTHDNSKNVTIDPKLTLNLKAISHYQDLISLNEFKANCGDSKKTLTVIKTHVSVDIPSNIQRIHDFERVIGITDLINLIDYKNIDTLFDENSETLADTCIIIVFPFNLIPTEHECDHFKSKSKRRKTCDIEPKMSVNQGKNNNNPFRIHPCSECRQFSELVTKLSKEFKEKTIFSVTTETPRFHVGIHWRYDKHDYCNVFNNGHTKLSDVSSFKRKKYKICERIQNVDKFELAARLCDYYTRGRFEKRNANFGYLYFATADKRLAYEIKDVFDESGCDLMLVGRTELDGFLQKHGAVQGFEECVYEEVLSMVEQELIASSRMLMLSQESTFSKRIASLFSHAQTAANLTTSPQNPASHPTQIQNTTSPLQQHQQQPNQQHQQIIDQQRQRAIQFNTMRYHNHINNTAGVQQNNYHLLPQNTLNQQTDNASKIQQISPMVNGSATGVPTQQPQSGGQY